MNLYLISQNVNTDWDTYDFAVVAAESASLAQRTYPGVYLPRDWPESSYDDLDEWTSPANVHVKYIGEAAYDIAAGVICASFKAG